jgi:hypothetical protein
MSSIFEQIKSNAVPVGVMRTASKGALPISASEMLEILVYLTHNPVFGNDARMTLAGWDYESAVKVLSDPKAPPEVMGYYWTEGNRRISLMPALIENPAVPETMLIELATECRRELVNALLASPRVRSSPALTEALTVNPELTPDELHALRGISPAMAAESAHPGQLEHPGQPEHPEQEDAESQAAHHAWHQEHASEIAAQEGKAFELVGEDEEPAREVQHTQPAEPARDKEEANQPAAMNSAVTLAATALGAGERDLGPGQAKKLSVLQKVARMNAAQRVKAAFAGGRDERMILIRDAARVVQNAVLASPKLSDPEVETFASAKNVHENVLREIARTRRFMKNYNVVRNLVNNPKCPLDLSLNLVKSLLVFDLKSLRNNKNVPETIRQVAFKLYREKSGPAKEAKRTE